MTNRKPLRINTDREYYKLLFTRRLIKNPPAEILAEHNQREEIRLPSSLYKQELAKGVGEK